jgi:hypothetical protein
MSEKTDRLKIVFFWKNCKLTALEYPEFTLQNRRRYPILGLDMTRFHSYNESVLKSSTSCHYSTLKAGSLPKSQD